MQATSLIWAASFLPKGSPSVLLGFNSYQRGPNKPKTSLPFFVWLLAYVCAWAWKLCAIRCNAHQLSNFHLQHPKRIIEVCTWNVPGSTCCQWIFFVHSLCRGFLATADKTLQCFCSSCFPAVRLSEKKIYGNYEAWFSNEVKIL